MTNRIAATFLSALVAFCASVSISAQPLPESQSSTVFLRHDAHAAVQQLTGRGIVLPGGFASPRAFDAAGAEIVWKESRRSTDPLGREHVFYRQHLVARGVDAELVGSEVGVHFTASGEFESIGGTQFESVFVRNRPRFNRIEALRHGSDSLRTSRGEPAEVPRAAVDEVVAHRANQTALRLVQVNGEFRFAYFTYAADAQGGYHSVVLDAEDARLIAVSEPNPGSNCTPQNRATSVAAVGIPIRSGVANRDLRAAPSTDRPAPFTHDGFYLSPSPTYQPSQSVYEEQRNPDFRCDVSVSTSYTLFPLRTDANGIPTYGDFPDTTGFEGKVAGDALYHTYQTMRAFTTMGRKSWNGSNGEAKIVIDSTFPAADQAIWIRVPPTGRMPADCVVVGRPSAFYTPAAALDVIAHEWGHGAIFDEVDLPYNTTAEQQLHEGLADVIGHIVEKHRQPAGSGLERSGDWTIAEDLGVSGYERGALDDGTGHTFTGPDGLTGPIPYNQQIHRLDSGGSQTVHGYGTMLSMVYRLMVEGGRNPICDRSYEPVSGYTGCEAGFSVSGVGLDKASRIMFQSLYEMPSTVRWTTIADYVIQAAFALYNGCSAGAGHNQVVQDAVRDSFYAVGFSKPAYKLCP